MKPLYFSIVIPAHNEAGYIAQTLERIRNLSYPKDLYETIVVENGSSDDTLAIAKRYESERLRVIKNESSGVSRARNAGIDLVSAQSDWVVLLDADTLLDTEFLNELNAFLAGAKQNVVGTTSVRPYPETAKAKLWFSFYDICHRVFKVSYSINIVKRSLFPAVRFNETLSAGEDLDMIKQARKHGAFFFLPTQTVSTSTRRFDQAGYWNIFFYWTFVGNLPINLRRRFNYAVTR